MFTFIGIGDGTVGDAIPRLALTSIEKEAKIVAVVPAGKGFTLMVELEGDK